MRTRDEEPFEVYYTVDPGHVPEVVRSVQEAEWQEVLVQGGAAGASGEGTKPDVPVVPENNEEEEVAATKQEAAPKTIVLPPDKDLRMGAKATKLLDRLNLPNAKREQLIKDATALARRMELPKGRSETILRDYYLYEAGDIPMPANVQAQWEHFKKTGSEMSPGAAKASTEEKPDPGKAKADGQEVAQPSAEGSATPPSENDEDATL